MKIIFLTQGEVALVDDCDFAWLNEFKWYHSQGYARRNSPRRKGEARPPIHMHREILKRMGVDDPHVDHINHDGLDNRRGNLRGATPTQNARNRKMYKNNKSGIPGVTWDSKANKWRAYIRVDKRLKLIGFYTNLVQAGEARKAAEKKYFGEFAYCGP